MVWSDITFDVRTLIYVFERGSVSGVRYRDQVLEPHVCIFRGAWGPKFILMDNSTRSHIALLTDEFLESEDISLIDWPSRSPDLNPIDHVWGALRRAITTQKPTMRTFQEMKTALRDDWDQLPHTRTDKLPYFEDGHKVNRDHHRWTAETFLCDRLY
ncbi:DDE_3 domain-containing protein [Trichonephila clavipes]|nr:DDE_3 domain-containing protein [Trichonephila clavipes]